MPSGRNQFLSNHLNRLGESVDLAEDVVSSHFGLSEDFWKKDARFELATLADLDRSEITDFALAQIIKYQVPDRRAHRTRSLYRICLQDHRILKAGNSRSLSLETLLSYVITHELIHLVRFARHDQIFEARAKVRPVEESLVHEISGQLLMPLGLQGLDDVLRFTAPVEDGVVMEQTRWAVDSGGKILFSGGWQANAHL